MALHTAPAFPGSEGRTRTMVISSKRMILLYRMKEIFAGKRALVIGGTGGIGRAVALGLAERGAAVTITGGASRERLDAALADLDAVSPPFCAAGPGAGGHRGFLCRIGRPDHGRPGGNRPGPQQQGGLSPEEAAGFILERTAEPEGPNILVVAWGPFKRASLGGTTPADWRFLTENNLIFPGILVSAVINGMVHKKWGRILLFGGTRTGEIRGFSTTAAYSAAKTALGVLVKSAAKAAKNTGVTCNALCPGFTDTEYLSPQEREYNREKSPGGRALVPGEVARIALEILENPLRNGELIAVERGVP